MSIFGYFSRARREQRRLLKQLSQFSGTFNTMSKLEQSHMLSWDAKQRRLFISQPLARLMMGSERQWRQFVSGCYLYQYYRLCQNSWNEFMQAEEQAAVQQAANTADGHGANMTRADIERIRRARRQQIVSNDMAAPGVSPFEFFVVRDTLDAQANLVAVGYFDPEQNQMEIAPWSRISALINENSDSQ